MPLSDYLRYSAYRDVLARKRLTTVVERVSAYANETQKDGLKILDLGCGIGGMTFPLSYLGHRVKGVDVDPKSIEACNSQNDFSNATYLVGDIGTIDLQEKFDVVICSEVLEHSLNPKLLLQTIAKHLTQGGIAVVTVPNGYCLYELVFSRFLRRLKVVTLFHKLPKKVYTALTGSPSPYHSLNVFCDHVQFFTFSRFIRLLNECGFQLLSVGNLGLGLLLDWKWLNHLKRIECKLADFAPHTIAGGWVCVIKLNGEESNV